MKQIGILTIGIILIACIVQVVSFEAIALFWMAGIVPGTDIRLASSTMLAIMFSSATILIVLHRMWRETVLYSERLYDNLMKLRRKPGTTTDPQLPRRRFGRI